MELASAELGGKGIVLTIFAAVALLIVLISKFGRKTHTPLAHRFGKSSLPNRRPLGMEATDINEVARIGRQNELIGIRNEGRNTRLQMPDGATPAASLSDADYAKRYQKAFGDNSKGPNND
jgi:hypothetical protein